MGCFVKEKTLNDATSVYKILQVPFDQASEHKDASKVDIGFAAEAALGKLKSQWKVSKRQILEIKMFHGEACVERVFSLNKEVEVETEWKRNSL